MKKKSWLDTALVVFMPACFLLMWVALWFARALGQNAQGYIVVGFLVPLMVASIWADARREQRKDEVEIAAIRFGARWSFVPVWLLMVTSALLPEFRAGLLDFARTLDEPNHSMFYLGVWAAFVVQIVAAGALRTVWLRSKVRP